MRQGTTVLFLVVLMTTIINPNTAKAEDLDFSGQMLLPIGGTVKLTDISDTTSLGIYGHGTFMYPIGGDPLLFGYIGPELSIGDHNLKLLTGAFFGGGSSMITSMWYSVSNLWTKGLEFFAEFDVYFPIQGHDRYQYYMLSNVTYSVTNITFGLETEFFGNMDGDTFEAAVGPSIKVGPVSFWLAYDARPALEGHGMFLRLTLKP